LTINKQGCRVKKVNHPDMPQKLSGLKYYHKNIYLRITVVYLWYKYGVLLILNCFVRFEF